MDDYEIKDPVKIEEKVLQELLDENKRLREENERLLDGIQHILDFYPIERADYIPIDILFEIHMKLKAIVKEHDLKC